MSVRIWFAFVVPLVFFASGIGYYVTRSTAVAATGGVAFLVVLFIGWYLAANSAKS